MGFTCWDTLRRGHSCKSCQNQTNLQTKHMTSLIIGKKLCTLSKSHCFSLCIACCHPSLGAAQHNPSPRQALLPTKAGGWWIPARSASAAQSPSPFPRKPRGFFLSDTGLQRHEGCTQGYMNEGCQVLPTQQVNDYKAIVLEGEEKKVHCWQLSWFYFSSPTLSFRAM